MSDTCLLSQNNSQTSPVWFPGVVFIRASGMCPLSQDNSKTSPVLVLGVGSSERQVCVRCPRTTANPHLLLLPDVAFIRLPGIYCPVTTINPHLLLLPDVAFIRVSLVPEQQ